MTNQRRLLLKYGKALAASIAAKANEDKAQKSLGIRLTWHSEHANGDVSFEVPAEMYTAEFPNNPGTEKTYVDDEGNVKRYRQYDYGYLGDTKDGHHLWIFASTKAEIVGRSADWEANRAEKVA